MSEKSPKNIKNTCKTNIYKFRANSKKAQQVNPSPFKSAQVPWTYFFVCTLLEGGGFVSGTSVTIGWRRRLSGSDCRRWWRRWWWYLLLSVQLVVITVPIQSSFSMIRHFLPNPGSILPALTFYGRNLLNVNAGRILPGFGRKWRVIENFILWHLMVWKHFHGSNLNLRILKFCSKRILNHTLGPKYCRLYVENFAELHYRVPPPRIASPLP